MSLGAALVALGAILVSLPMKDGRLRRLEDRPAATPLATIATPMPDQTSDRAARTPISESRSGR